MTNKIKLWILVFLVITSYSGLVYITVQQDMRIGANDPQIQMAEDAGALLSNGQTPESVVPSTKVDIAQSLASFMIVYDSSGKPLASSAQLDNSTPEVPRGVFDNVRKNGEDRLTWQPKPSVRVAAVITNYSGKNPGFVLAGRSLREVENRESLLTQQVGLAWLVTIVLTLIVILLFPL